jgi:hypothetical protein
VVAHVKNLNINQGTFVLSGFSYVETDWKERQYERVRPQKPTYITLKCRGKAFRATMENVSVNGMGVLAYKLFERGMKLRPGSNILIDFQLPPDYEFSDLKGKIVYLHRIDKLLVKLGVRLYPKTKETHSMEKYIAHRKQEIMEELDQAFFEICKPRGVENLFF